MKYMKSTKFVCPKCGNTRYETGKFRATGSGLSKLFDIQTEKFDTLTCTECGYTEIYKCPSNVGEDVLDFFVGN